MCKGRPCLCSGILLVSVAALALPARAQPGPPSASLVETLHGYLPASLSGEGFDQAVHAYLPDLLLGNPGGLAAFDEPAVGLSAQYGTPSAWISDLRVGPDNTPVPQSMAFVYPLGPWRLGVGTARLYSSSFDYPSIDVSTEEGPAGASDSETHGRVRLVGPVVAYVGGTARSRWAAGVRLAWVRATRSGSLSGLEVSEAADGIAWGVGLRYDLHLAGRRSVQLGAFAEGPVEASGSGKPPPGLNECWAGPEEQTGCVDLVAYDVAARLPGRAGGGASATLLPGVTARAGASYAFWRTVDEAYDGGAEWSLALLADVHRALTLSVSYFDAGRAGLPETYRGDSHAMRFVAAGAVARLGRTRLDVVVADSRRGSAALYAQTLVRVGLGRTF